MDVNDDGVKKISKYITVKKIVRKNKNTEYDNKKSKNKKKIKKVIAPIEQIEEEPENITETVNLQLENNRIIKSLEECQLFLKEKGVSISTITLDCKLGSKIDVNTFAKKVVLSETGVASVKYGDRNHAAVIRTIVVVKPKKKQSKRNFYNQVTILMKPTNNPSRNYLNIKVFDKGTLQMTGCKDMEDFNNVVTTLIGILTEKYKVKNPNKNEVKLGKKYIEKTYALEPEKMGIYDVNIRMINSNFKLGYKIDREKLTSLLKTHHRINTKDKEIGHVECKHDPNGRHSCVNIKYQYDEVSCPSIFVFHTGSIIITGAKNLHHIVMAYKFINKILDRYLDQIKVVEMNEKDMKSALFDFFNGNKKNVRDV